jgi:small subunit ribosomal protein S1
LPSSDAGDGGGEELHLLDKPFPSPSTEDEAEPEPAPAPAPSTEEALASYLNFFQAKNADASADTEASSAAAVGFAEDGAGAGGRGVVYYDPKPGDLVVGVVVGGDARVLDVDVGAGGEPALMLTKEAAPASREEFGYLACDVASSDGAREFAAEGRVGVAVSGGRMKAGRAGKAKCAPVVGVGTVVFAEVLGRTLGGRPLLSARRMFRRAAWHRVRQVLYDSPLYFCPHMMN